MSKLKCGCVVADSRNTAAVRKGFEMGGYVKHFCAEHKPKLYATNEQHAVVISKDLPR